MSFSTEDAITDELVLGLVPTSAEVGRQVKRVKTSTILNSCTETIHTVTDAVIGARFAKATCMAVDMVTNTAGEGARENPGLIGAIGVALTTACAPQGAIWGVVDNAIGVACRPGGHIEVAMKEAIVTACQPEGAVHNAITVAMTAMEQRSIARLRNGNVFDRPGLLHPLEGRDNTVPAEFPGTYGAFADMTIGTMNSLLAHYGLAATGSRSDKLQRLSAFCHVNLPK